MVSPQCVFSDILQDDTFCITFIIWVKFKWSLPCICFIVIYNNKFLRKKVYHNSHIYMAFPHCVLSDVLQDYYFEQSFITLVKFKWLLPIMCSLMTYKMIILRKSFIIIFAFKWLLFFQYSKF